MCHPPHSSQPRFPLQPAETKLRKAIPHFHPNWKETSVETMQREFLKEEIYWQLNSSVPLNLRSIPVQLWQLHLRRFLCKIQLQELLNCSFTTSFRLFGRRTCSIRCKNGAECKYCLLTNIGWEKKQQFGLCSRVIMCTVLFLRFWCWNF